MKKLISINDTLIVLGLALLGEGLFLWFGMGPALTGTGAMVLLITLNPFGMFGK